MYYQNRRHLVPKPILSPDNSLKPEQFPSPHMPLPDHDSAAILNLQDGQDGPADVGRLVRRLGPKSYRIMGISGGGPYDLACALLLPPEQLKSVVVVGGAAPPAAAEAMGTSDGERRWRQRIISEPEAEIWRRD
ncbi:hypothetical protein B0H63DRAFT_446115 [Podospora didyma]|uniref:Uncharacterized protein n=1 Tax=Podospora didyma TaxID=330526 RepID=A0AAE0NY44_9PEZI|nr:hypothetical protein B0H63DRAFT_446115 [Podospora didyma]